MTAEESELTIARFIKAPPAIVWKAWSTPEHLAKWWIPAPIECQVVKLDLRPGGGFETRMREGGGAFQPHVEGCFLEIVPEARLVFTTVLTEGWRPAEPWLALTAIITFQAEAGAPAIRPASCTRMPRTPESMKTWAFRKAGEPPSTSLRHAPRNWRDAATRSLAPVYNPNVTRPWASMANPGFQAISQA